MENYLTFVVRKRLVATAATPRSMLQCSSVRNMSVFILTVALMQCENIICNVSTVLHRRKTEEVVAIEMCIL